MPRKLTVSRVEVERHRSVWKSFAVANGWIKQFKRDGFPLQIFIDARSGRVTDSIYRRDGVRGDIFSNRNGRRELRGITLA